MGIKRLASFLVIAGLLLLLPASVLGLDQSLKTQNIEVKKGEVIDHDFFAAGESVAISGVVNGDVYAAGGTVSVDGKVNGDLLVGAGVVTILGEVTDDVRVGGGNVLINGLIGKNLTVAGGSVTITNEAKINGSILAFCGLINVRGPVGRGANVFAGKALFANQVGGDLKGAMENLVLTSQARILGDLEYESKDKAEISEEALVVGENIHKLPEKGEVKLRKIAPQVQPVIFGLAKIKLYLSIFNFFVSLVLGLVFLSLFPKRAEGIVKILTSRPWGSLGVALLTFVLFPVALVVLAITIIGIPLLLLLLPVFGFLVYFGKIFTSLAVGRWLLLRFKIKRSWRWALLAGLIVYYLLGLIIVIGPLVAFVFTTLGVGAFILDQKALRRSSRKKA